MALTADIDGLAQQIVNANFPSPSSAEQIAAKAASKVAVKDFLTKVFAYEHTNAAISGSINGVVCPPYTQVTPVNLANGELT